MRVQLDGGTLGSSVRRSNWLCVQFYSDPGAARGSKRTAFAHLRSLLRNLRMVGRGGLEPPTSRLSGVRSNHLSYRPISRASGQGRGLVEPNGIEPLTS